MTSFLAAEFRRVVYVATGHLMQEQVVDTVFKIFDSDYDGALSYEEFILRMIDRQHMGFRLPVSQEEQRG